MMSTQQGNCDSDGSDKYTKRKKSKRRHRK